jgi:hypothetical protein
VRLAGVGQREPCVVWCWRETMVWPMALPAGTVTLLSAISRAHELRGITTATCCGLDLCQARAAFAAPCRIESGLCSCAQKGPTSAKRLSCTSSPRPAPRCMQESHNPCSVCTGAESKVAADRVDDRAEDNARAGTRSQPGTNRSGAATAGETGPRSASGSAPAPEGKDLGHVVVNRPGHRRNWIRPHRLAGDHRARAAHYPAGLIAALVCRRADDGVDR